MLISTTAVHVRVATKYEYFSNRGILTESIREKSYRKLTYGMFPTSQSDGSSVSNVLCTYSALITDRKHSRI